MPKLPVPSVPHEVLQILRREAEDRRTTLTQLVKEIVIEWAIERECERRCGIADRWVWEECEKMCIEAMRKTLLGG